MTSLITRKIISPNKSTKPTNETMFLTLSGIFFLLIPSTAKTSSCQPSNPGNGIKLTIAKLTETMPHTLKNELTPKFLRILVDSKAMAIIPPVLSLAS